MIKKFLKLSSISLLITSPALAADRPNILFIAVDDLKPLLSCYGDPIAKTPNFDRLAERSIVFTNSHCNQAVCGPSRASLLTGLRPDRTKVHDLKTITREVTPWVVTLPEQLKNNGYTTAGVGKIYDPRSVDKKSDAPSWSRPFILHNLKYNNDFPKPVLGAYQGKQQHEALEKIEASGTKGYGPTRKKLEAQELHRVTEAEDVADDAYSDGAIARHGVELIRELSDKDKPFFVAVGFKKPHLPFIAPKKYWDLYDRESLPLAEFQKKASGSPEYAYHDSNELRSYAGIPEEGGFPEDLQRELIHGYYACVSYIDTQLGLLLDELDKQSLTDKTVIVLWGDHGWHLGDHGIWCKHTNYEQATRSPLFISVPSMKTKGTNASPVEFVDIYPTLCELSSTPAPANLDGRSLVPVLEGKEKAIRDYAVSQFGRGKRMGYGLRGDRYRYVVWCKMNQDGTPVDSINSKVDEELYDYQTDPLETKNLAADPAQAEVLKKFRDYANEFLSEQQKRISLEPK